MTPYGRAYRLGGDEFCAVVDADVSTAGPIIDKASAALSEEGDGYAVAASHGVVYLPDEAVDAKTAMQIADRRLYAHKAERKVGRDFGPIPESLTDDRRVMPR
jgi:predicted signal transduction protein with EAL and GGDEF domain